MPNRRPSQPDILLRDIATFEIIHVQGVSVRKMAVALQVSRQTVYRRMQAVLSRARRLKAKHSEILTRPYDLHTERTKAMASTFTSKLNLEKPDAGGAQHQQQVPNANLDIVDAAMFTLPSLTADPTSPVEGDMWLRSDLLELRMFISGAVGYISISSPE